MTHGDTQAVKCPACRYLILKPLAGDEPARGDIAEIEIHCPHCHVKLRLWARWLIVVDCEKESKVK